MESRDLIESNLRRSRELVLAHVEDMRDHCMIRSTPRGGPHTLWVLGHLAYIEALVIQTFMRGSPNPLAEWEDPFDGAEVSDAVDEYPAFDVVLGQCIATRESTLALLTETGEADLDSRSAGAPAGWESTFGTFRMCFQYVADHWYMHRGHLADARRAAGIARMWV